MLPCPQFRDPVLFSLSFYFISGVCVGGGVGKKKALFGFQLSIGKIFLVVLCFVF